MDCKILAAIILKWRCDGFEAATFAKFVAGQAELARDR